MKDSQDHFNVLRKIKKKPYKIFIKKPESFDIDTMYDFKLAEMYYKNRNTNRLL